MLRCNRFEGPKPPHFLRNIRQLESYGAQALKLTVHTPAEQHPEQHSKLCEQGDVIPKPHRLSPNPLQQPASPRQPPHSPTVRMTSSLGTQYELTTVMQRSVEEQQLAAPHDKGAVQREPRQMPPEQLWLGSQHPLPHVTPVQRPIPASTPASKGRQTPF